MNWGFIKSIILLPGNALVIIPAIILFLTINTPFSFEIAGIYNPLLWLAVIIGIKGVVLSSWSTKLFFKFGKGTPAPWEPTRRLILYGPYRHVRNPMITGAILIQLAESLFFQSIPLLVYTALFIIANLIYIPMLEEKGLEKRFGKEYLEYKKNVPRWIPRIKAWKTENKREK